MSEKLEIGVIGLGKFGLNFAKSMIKLKHNVLGIDRNPEKVKQAQNILTQVYQAEILDENALFELGINNLSHVLVSVGDSITASSMISMYLQEIGIKKVWVKAISEDHKKLLNKIGIANVIIPENIAANQLATKITIPGLIDFLPFDNDIVLKELIIDKLAGKTLRDIDLTNTYNTQVIAVKKKDETIFGYIPKADCVMEAGDTIIIIGNLDMINKIKP